MDDNKAAASMRLREVYRQAFLLYLEVVIDLNKLMRESNSFIILQELIDGGDRSGRTNWTSDQTNAIASAGEALCNIGFGYSGNNVRKRKIQVSAALSVLTESEKFLREKLIEAANTAFRSRKTVWPVTQNDEPADLHDLFVGVEDAKNRRAKFYLDKLWQYGRRADSPYELEQSFLFYDRGNGLTNLIPF